jgi:hypothetical protein
LRRKRHASDLLERATEEVLGRKLPIKYLFHDGRKLESSVGATSQPTEFTPRRQGAKKTGEIPKWLPMTWQLGVRFYTAPMAVRSRVRGKNQRNGQKIFDEKPVL